MNVRSMTSVVFAAVAFILFPMQTRAYSADKIAPNQNATLVNLPANTWVHLTPQRNPVVCT